MSNPPGSHHIEIMDSDGQTAAAADVTALGPEAARASLHAGPDHAPPGSRAELVDAVMQTPEVQERTRLEATVPLGDAEAIERLQERTEEVTIRSAGATVLLDATIRPPPEPAPGEADPP